MTCAITLFKRTRSTVRNESYKRRWQSQVLSPFSHLNEVQKPQTVKISTGNNECPNVQTSHPLFIRVVTWVLQLTPLTKERERQREPERDERDGARLSGNFFWRFLGAENILFGSLEILEGQSVLKTKSLLNVSNVYLTIDGIHRRILEIFRNIFDFFR